MLLAARVALPTGFGAGLDRPLRRWDGGSRWLIAQDFAAIGLAALFLLVPLAMIVVRGVPGLADLTPDIARAGARSVAVALVSTALCIGAALVLALAIQRGAAWMEVAGMLPLAASSLVLEQGFSC